MRIKKCVFYRCKTCGLITNEYFKTCPNCGTDSVKVKEKYLKCEK